MRLSDQPEIVTVVACSPYENDDASHNPFIEEVCQELARKATSGNRVVRAASVLDMDLQLSEILTPQFRGRVRLQVVGHSLSGMLSLGAQWIPEQQRAELAYHYPFYVLDTTPAALQLLAKYVGKISEVMLVACNVGSTASYGYAINGRTLTYTLAELLQCQVRGADDVVGSDEFDARGWYAPSAQSRRPKGWRWVDSRPPMWIDPGTDATPQRRSRTVISFEVRSITSTVLPVPGFKPLALEPTIHLVCRQFDGPKQPTALAEVTVETDQGPAELLCGGRFLKLADTYYVVEKHPALSAMLTGHLWKQPAGDASPSRPSRSRSIG